MGKFLILVIVGTVVHLGNHETFHGRACKICNFFLLKNLWLLFLTGHCDICLMPPDSGSCSDPASGKEEARFYYSAKNLKCTEMPYSGCGGNPNNFKSLAECNEKCGKKRKVYKFSNYFPPLMVRLCFDLADNSDLHLFSSWHSNGEGYFSSPEGLQVLVRKQDI